MRDMRDLSVGYAICGSFCTHSRAVRTLERLRAEVKTVVPIVSEVCTTTNTRFGKAPDLLRELERICDRNVIGSIAQAEPIGPEKLLDVLVICPCTGNTLAKLAAGVTDSSVTMAAKAHLRNGRPLVIGVSTNDGLYTSARNMAELLCRKNVYFIPFRQDDPKGKPASLVAEFALVEDTIREAREGRQLQPLLLPAAR